MLLQVWFKLLKCRYLVKVRCNYVIEGIEKLRKGAADTETANLLNIIYMEILKMHKIGKIHISLQKQKLLHKNNLVVSKLR